MDCRPTCRSTTPLVKQQRNQEPKCSSRLSHKPQLHGKSTNRSLIQTSPRTSLLLRFRRKRHDAISLRKTVATTLSNRRRHSSKRTQPRSKASVSSAPAVDTRVHRHGYDFTKSMLSVTTMVLGRYLVRNCMGVPCNPPHATALYNGSHHHGRTYVQRYRGW